MYLRTYIHSIDNPQHIKNTLSRLYFQYIFICHGLVVTITVYIQTNSQPNNYEHICRDNYNSLTLAKLPPKNEHGQLKSICTDKRADKINILIEKIIRVIRTTAALEVMITLHPRVVVESG